MFNYEQSNIGNPEIRQALKAIDVELTALRAAGANGTNFNLLMTKLNTYFTAFNAVLAKLDADGGVTDADYASLHAVDVVTAGSFTDLNVTASTAAGSQFKP